MNSPKGPIEPLGLDRTPSQPQLELPQDMDRVSSGGEKHQF